MFCFIQTLHLCIAALRIISRLLWKLVAGKYKHGGGINGNQDPGISIGNGGTTGNIFWGYSLKFRPQKKMFCTCNLGPWKGNWWEMGRSLRPTEMGMGEIEIDVLDRLFFFNPWNLMLIQYIFSWICLLFLIGRPKAPFQTHLLTWWVRHSRVQAWPKLTHNGIKHARWPPLT